MCSLNKLHQIRTKTKLRPAQKASERLSTVLLWLGLCSKGGGILLLNTTAKRSDAAMT